MAWQHEFISADHCQMCRQIAAYRAVTPGYAHKDGCGCSRCARVEELADAREQGKKDAEVAKAYAEGLKKGLSS